MAAETSMFHWADYVTFSLSLVVSIAVGIYYGMFNKREANVEEFFLGGRDLAVVPVAISLFISWFSALSFLGDPVEVYYYGAVYWYSGLGYVLGLLPIIFYFAARYQKMKYVSACELLEVTYNKPFRIIAAVIAIIGWIPYFSLLLFAPCMALQQVSGISVEILIIVTGVVCLFYSVLGGMRGVVWADTLQMVILVGGIIAMVTGGLIQVGGFKVMWQKSMSGERLNFNKFSPNPGERSTFWTYTIGGFTKVFFPYIGSQVHIQRYFAVRTKKDATMVAILSLPMLIIVVCIMALTGLIMFAYFGNCDPMVTSKVTRPDQMVPLMVMEVLGFAHGVPGLFMASIVCAALSSLSSVYNSTSVTLLRDIVQQAYEGKYKKSLPENTATKIAKILTCAVGVVVICLALVIRHIQSTLFSISTVLFSIVIGPQAAVFFMALILPSVDWISVVCGLVVGILVPSVIGYGALLSKPTYHRLPLYICGCPLPPSANQSSVISDVTVSTMYSHQQPFIKQDWCTLPDQPQENNGFSATDVYNLSPLLYSGLSFLLVVAVAVLCVPIVRIIRNSINKRSNNSQQEDLKNEQTSIQLL